MEKHLVLLSGGLDSTVNLASSHSKGRARMAVTCDYGQRAASREIKASEALCRHYNIPHRIIRIPWLGKLAANPLTDEKPELPDPAMMDEKSADAQVWVPNRNGLLLNIAAAIAEAMEIDHVLVGFNAEEAENFPDNSEDFLRAAQRAFEYSTQSKVKLVCHTIDMRKPEIIKLARDMGAPLQLCWWCYDGGEEMCGRCGSCRRFLHAAKESGCEDWLKSKGVL